MKVTGLAAAAMLMLLLAACGSSGQAPHAGVTSPDDGTVSGTFMRVGGPLGAGGSQPPAIPLTGTVLFAAGHRSPVAVAVGKSGRFTVRLPAGRYRVSGSSPSIDGSQASGGTRALPCAPPMPVTVLAGKTVHVSVICSVP